MPEQVTDELFNLHYFPESGNSYKVALMLTLCGVPWRPIYVDFFGGVTRTEQWRKAVNEMGKFPCSSMLVAS